MIKVVLLGAGNVAVHLTKMLLKSASIELVQVYNRSIDKIAYLKNETAITTKIPELKEADIYIICVSDNAISKVSKQLNFEGKLVVHTSGATDLAVLKCNANKGVLYPLQSFSKDKKVDFSEVPFCLEAENSKDLELLQKITNAIGSPSYKINSEQRKTLHVAAVFVNNFVNHLYQIGNEICSKEHIPFEILAPLIKETALKIEDLTPFEAQTGPAKRNDTKTIETHLSLLTNNQQKIYTLLTQSIINLYGEKL
ncbi:Predicted oxidoreductase, contains short-chain dehydrogenase (SDR) and DUF2520 domains [Lutibacter agarilyticus]|uniref:Predicted oxidoreductase, contains short-chain dehydrogenase (SDR) and DUF2520 domains n=1 Tax=Lutibacter agarilyticus TaxID=1109740 RepID=A0A238VL42_9FLAO|nr:Rossmann-like and DUF2520 domain-containing protein [Lutibacter agarilyticus]SNR34443.1 Predicted oxidoreductase, contains short-chain dehydrogenase (SDR) and DUF2520 domains [Lutibacter agarilyticus]